MTYAGGRLLAGFPADSRPPVFLFSVVTRPVRPHPPHGPEEGAGRLSRRLGRKPPTVQWEFWNAVGERPVRFLKYLPNEDWFEKLSS